MATSRHAFKFLTEGKWNLKQIRMTKMNPLMKKIVQEYPSTKKTRIKNPKSRRRLPVRPPLRDILELAELAQVGPRAALSGW